MANSKIGNYVVEFEIQGFTAPVRSHVHAVYVAPTTVPAPGALPADIDIQLKGGGTATLQEFANLYCSFFRPFYATSITVEAFSMWRYVTENSRDFITAGNAVPTTLGTGAVTIAQQATYTLRTAGGNILKLVYLENNGVGDSQIALVANAVGNSRERLAAYMLSAACGVIGIDNSFAIAPLRASFGQNEKIWRNVYR